MTLVYIVSGGYVYRGQAYAPLLEGAYVFGDYVSRSVEFPSVVVTCLSLLSLTYMSHVTSVVEPRTSPTHTNK